MEAGAQASLEGRVVAIAGASGNLGPIVVQRLARAGARLAFGGRSKESLDELASELGIEADTAAVDLLDAAAARDWADGIAERLGGVDALVHLVGGWRGGQPIEEAPLEDWAVLEPMLVRTLQHATQAFAGHLIECGHGRFVDVSSGQGQAPTSKNAVYAAAKAAGEAWTLALADRFKGTGATANIVVVGSIVTPAMREETPDKDFATFTPAEEIAEAIAYLCSDAAATMNGQRLTLPAGRAAEPDARAVRDAARATATARPPRARTRGRRRERPGRGTPENGELRGEPEVREDGHRRAVVVRAVSSLDVGRADHAVESTRDEPSDGSVLPAERKPVQALDRALRPAAGRRRKPRRSAVRLLVELTRVEAHAEQDRERDESGEGEPRLPRGRPERREESDVDDEVDLRVEEASQARHPPGDSRQSTVGVVEERLQLEEERGRDERAVHDRERSRNAGDAVREHDRGRRDPQRSEREREAMRERPEERADDDLLRRPFLRAGRRRPPRTGLVGADGHLGRTIVDTGRMTESDGWSESEGALERTFAFKDFREALDFV